MPNDDVTRWVERKLRDLCRPLVLSGLAAAILLGICGRVYLLGRPLGLGMNNSFGVGATPGTHEMYFWRVTSTPRGLTGNGSLIGLRFLTRPGAGGVWVQELHVAFWTAFVALVTMWLTLEGALRTARHIRRRRQGDVSSDALPATV